MIFLLEFLLLTLGYLVVGVLLATILMLVWSRMVRRPMDFPEALDRALMFFGLWPNPPDAPANIMDNRRWFTLVGMTIVTFVIALDNPGAPALIESLRNLPRDLLGESAFGQVWGELTYVWSGQKSPGGPRIEQGPGWFWWKAVGMYTLLTVIYFFPAFWDDLTHAVGEAMDIFRDHQDQERGRRRQNHAKKVEEVRRRNEKHRQRGEPEEPPPPPPSMRMSFGDFLKWDLFVEALLALLGGFFRHYFERRQIV